MKIYNKKTLQENTDTCCVNTEIKELTEEETGDQGFNMKIFKMNPGGYSPLHSHASQHRLFIVDGKGTVFNGQEATEIKADDIVYITPNEPHQLRTVGEKPLKFICLTIDTK